MAKVKRSSGKSGRPAAANKPPRLGTHVSIAGGMYNAPLAAVELGCDTFQVFVKHQRQWQAPALKSDDLACWHKLLTEHELLPIAHATYLINLASGDDGLHEKSRAAFADELLRCDALAIPYLVVHPGARGEQEVERALQRVAAALNRIFKDHPTINTMPLLETTAGQGTALGRGFEELDGIIQLLDEPERVGVCIDTCHVFAAGYDIREPDTYGEMVAEVERTVGLERVRCWHFNDSKGECGSHLDRHAHIGHGNIGVAGFRNVLSDRRFRGVPMILETPKGVNDKGRDWDRVNLQRLRTIAARAGDG